MAFSIQETRYYYYLYTKNEWPFEEEVYSELRDLVEKGKLEEFRAKRNSFSCHINFNRMKEIFYYAIKSKNLELILYLAVVFHTPELNEESRMLLLTEEYEDVLYQLIDFGYVFE